VNALFSKFSNFSKGEKMKTDTIAAIATAMSPSGIGIVRISGDEAFSIIDRIYRSTLKKDSEKKLSECESHTIHYGFICDGEDVIDEVMVLLMRAPRSYTKEDSIEIDCHGGVYVVKRVLETVLKYGARPAEPGEFTKRAFLNGRIDLTQAESVIDVINSKNEFALKSSLSQLKGSVKEDITEIRGTLLHEIAYIESALDDPEHISLEGYPQRLYGIVETCSSRVEKLLASSDNGRMLKEGIQTVIVGKPNAGKSSLLNMLVGTDRAIVTEVAGTTRDILEEQIQLGGITLNLIDTAGIRDTADQVEQIGVERALKYASDADLILYVIDSSVPLDDNDRQIMEVIREKKTIVLLNKSDLEHVVDEDEISSFINSIKIKLSIKDNFGAEELEHQIKEMFFHGDISFNDEVYITNVRQKKSLQDCDQSLHLVKKSIEDGMPEDFYSIDLMGAYESLGAMIGESLEDDLVDEIFEKFCTGK
jgi:tRNA modification GTPase